MKNENKVAVDYLKLLKLKGKLKILIDRTEWKFGETWVNILTLSVAYKQVAIPILWQVGCPPRQCAGSRTRRARAGSLLMNSESRQLKEFMLTVNAGSYELLAYLIGEGIDFHIRLKTSHKSSGKSFLQRWKDVSGRVKLRGKVKIARLWFRSLCEPREISKERKNRISDCR